MSNAIFLLKMTQAKADQTTREYLDIIATEIANSTRIITDLLDFARTKTPHLSAVRAHELINSSLKKCSIPENIIIEVEATPALPPLNVDLQQMEQVLQNLISNGIQAMPDGGMLCLTARYVQSPQSKAQDFKDGNHDLQPTNIEAETACIEISVSDTGVGIPTENMKNLFQPLFTTKPKGIGLGLVVCRNLVEANGGRIHVTSEPAKGTTFTVALPVES